MNSYEHYKTVQYYIHCKLFKTQLAEMLLDTFKHYKNIKLTARLYINMTTNYLHCILTLLYTAPTWKHYDHYKSLLTKIVLDILKHYKTNKTRITLQDNMNMTC